MINWLEMHPVQVPSEFCETEKDSTEEFSVLPQFATSFKKSLDQVLWNRDNSGRPNTIAEVPTAQTKCPVLRKIYWLFNPNNHINTSYSKIAHICILLVCILALILAYMYTN